MPNQSIFNRKNNALYGNIKNSYTLPGATHPPQTAISSATAGYFSTNAANSISLGLLGGSVNSSIRIANPSNSRKTVHISQINVYTNISLSLLSGFSGQVTLYSSGTLSSPAALTPANGLFGSTATSISAVTSSTSAVTGGTAFILYPLYPGPFQLNFSGELVVPAGQTFCVNIVGSLTLLGLMGTGVEVLWWEI